MFVCKFESAKGKSVVLSLFTQGHFFDFWLPLEWKLRTYLIILNAFLISNRPNNPKSRIYVNPAQNTQNDCHWYVYTGTYPSLRDCNRVNSRGRIPCQSISPGEAWSKRCTVSWKWKFMNFTPNSERTWRLNPRLVPLLDRNQTVGQKPNYRKLF